MMIRIAQPDDISEILRIQAGAFTFSENTERCLAEREKISRTLANWLVLPVDGQIAGVVHVTPQRWQIGKAILLNGDVSNVAVSPFLQGHGIGMQLMQETVAWMKAEGFALSRLGGLVRFYSRFGYQRFPRRYVEFTVGKTAAAGNAQVVEGEVVLPPEMLRPVVPYDAVQHGAACLRLLQQFNRTYACVPDPGNAYPPDGPFCYVVEDDGIPIGFLRADIQPCEYSEFEAPITIREIACDVTKPQALQNLMAYIANLALQRGITRITVRLPFDPTISATLAELPLRFQFIETYGGLSGNMLRVINLPALCTQLLPELEERLEVAQVSWNGTLGLHVQEECATLRIAGTKSRLTEDAATVQLAIPPFHFLALTLGLLSFTEIEPLLKTTPALTGNDRTFLQALFPRRLVYSGGWG